MNKTYYGKELIRNTVMIINYANFSARTFFSLRKKKKQTEKNQPYVKTFFFSYI